MEDLFETLLPVVTMIIGVIAGVAATQYTRLRDKALADENKVNDIPFQFIDSVIDRITSAKAEDPKTPLGTPPADNQ